MKSILVALGMAVTMAACVSPQGAKFSAKQLDTDALSVACTNAAPLAQIAAGFYPPADAFLPAAKQLADQYCHGRLAGKTPSQAANELNTAFAQVLGTGVANH